MSEASTRSTIALTAASMAALLLAATLVMGAGWGIRGSFGHSRGAAMPGAMLGLTLAVCACRGDWWRRAAIIGLLSAVGWAFGGASSYGMLIGYSLKADWATSAYGYSSLFLVGALYSGIGAACLAIALTAKRSYLEAAAWPLMIIYATWLLLQWLGVEAWSLELFAKDPEQPEVTRWLYDTLWICALSALIVAGVLWVVVPRWREPLRLIVWLSAGWLIAMALLIGLAGLRINPSRADSWAGCVGLQIVFLVHFWRSRNRAALMLCGYGLIAGGLGFAIGQFVQARRARWGVIGSYPVLQEFGYWTIMEQIFGYGMGLGIGLAMLRLIRHNLALAEEDVPPGRLNGFAVLSLLGLIPVFNFLTIFRAWKQTNQLPELVLGQPVGYWLSSVAVVGLLLLAFALRLHGQGKLDIVPASPLGRAKLLTVLMIGLVSVLYLLLPSKGLPTSLMFVAALAISLPVILRVGPSPIDQHVAPSLPVDDPQWRLTWLHGVWWLAAPLIILVLAYLTTGLGISR